jgi:hypothetical protein
LDSNIAEISRISNKLSRICAEINILKPQKQGRLWDNGRQIFKNLAAEIHRPWCAPLIKYICATSHVGVENLLVLLGKMQ